MWKSTVCAIQSYARNAARFDFYAGLSDVPDSFGLGRPLPAKKRGAVRKAKGPKNYPKPVRRWAPCGCGAPVATPAK